MCLMRDLAVSNSSASPDQALVSDGFLEQSWKPRSKSSSDDVAVHVLLMLYPFGSLSVRFGCRRIECLVVESGGVHERPVSQPTTNAFGSRTRHADCMQRLSCQDTSLSRIELILKATKVCWICCPISLKSPARVQKALLQLLAV